MCFIFRRSNSGQYLLYVRRYKSGLFFGEHIKIRYICTRSESLYFYLVVKKFITLCPGHGKETYIRSNAGLYIEHSHQTVEIRNTISVIFAALFWSLRIQCATIPASSDPVITFRPGSDVLYSDYKSNRSDLKRLETIVTQYEDVILSGNGHIRLVAYMAPSGKDNPVEINMAATRGAVVRTYLCKKYRMLTKWNFTFYIDFDASKDNSLEVSFHHGRVAADAPGDIYYSTRKNSPDAIRAVLSRYGVPFLPAGGITPSESAGISAGSVPVVRKPSDDGRTAVAIYYRWDKWKLDSLYLSNPHNLRMLDSLLTSASARRIDTLTIVAFASPEGDSVYNRRLSERRAATIRDYIADRYGVDPGKIVMAARGENWEGLAGLAMDDHNLPSRNKVIDILRSPASDERKQAAITQLDGGTTYYRYILPNYYTYLRLGAMVFMSYAPPETLSAGYVLHAPLPSSVEIPFHPFYPQQLQPAPIAAKYPLAIKTNLLYDMVGAPNLGVEFPLGDCWSVVVDAAYAYWRAASHLYALQTLEYGVSGRYWLPVSRQRKLRNPEWDKPLRGWNFGIYGRYWQRYDVQWIDGCQGDGSWSAGITAGYAFPVGRNLSLEAGLGAGYFSTSQYRTYDRPLYDNDGDYHLMWRETGIWSGLTLTKVNFSLVWLIETGNGGAK